MFRNIFNTAIRNILKNKLFSAINIFGLSIGVTAFLLLFLYVYNEITYDKFHNNHSRIYRIRENQMEFTKGLTVPYLVKNFPEVENGTRMLNWSGKMLSSNGKDLMQQLHYVDTGFFNIFTFRFIEGNAEALKEKYSVVITRELAEKFFGTKPALNQTLKVYGGKNHLRIGGVIENFPVNSTLQFDLVTSYETGFGLDPWLVDVHDWYNTFSESYVLLKRETDIKEFEAKMVPFVEANFITGQPEKPKLTLLVLSNLHQFITNNKTFTYMLICIAFGILIIAIVNFINLFTAVSFIRHKEVGMRKTLGARRTHLNMQFLGESLTISLFAVAVGIILTILLLPVYNKMFETRLEFNPFTNPYLLFVIIAIWLLSGILSGIFPSINLSKIPMIDSIKGKVYTSSKLNYKNALVAVQFVIAIFLITGTIVIMKQINFMKNYSLNFDADNVVIIRTNPDFNLDYESLKRKFKVIQNELMYDNRVISTAFSNHVPGTYIENYNMFYTNGWSKQESVHLRQVDVCENYFKTYGIRFIEGDPLSESILKDSNAIVINKAALKKLEAVGAVNNYLFQNSKSGNPFKIIGVVEDFHYQGLHRDIQPLIHFYHKDKEVFFDYFSVRVRQGQMLPMLETLKKTWSSISPHGELDFFFASDEINKQYKFVMQTSTLAAYFSALAIIISCLGLFAMVIFVTNRKVKEIGIRKVMGANEGAIVAQLTKQYVVWIMSAFIVALPFSIYAMNIWLSDFAYKTDLNWWIFALAGLVALGIALLTVSFQSWKAASRNPIESLRYE